MVHDRVEAGTGDSSRQLFTILKIPNKATHCPFKILFFFPQKAETINILLVVSKKMYNFSSAPQRADRTALHFTTASFSPRGTSELQRVQPPRSCLSGIIWDRLLRPALF